MIGLQADVMDCCPTAAVMCEGKCTLSSPSRREILLKLPFPEINKSRKLLATRLVVRAPGYRSTGPGSIPGATRFSE
jgi:hypothetical protein